MASAVASRDDVVSNKLFDVIAPAAAALVAVAVNDKLAQGAMTGDLPALQPAFNLRNRPYDSVLIHPKLRVE